MTGAWEDFYMIPRRPKTLAERMPRYATHDPRCVRRVSVSSTVLTT
jgi:hypothetical protein